MRVCFKGKIFFSPNLFLLILDPPKKAWGPLSSREGGGGLKGLRNLTTKKESFFVASLEASVNQPDKAGNPISNSPWTGVGSLSTNTKEMDVGQKTLNNS